MKTKPVIAVDFDDTLIYANGIPNGQLISVLKNFRKKGGKLILWTCRNDRKLHEAVVMCTEMGLFFDAVNCNVPESCYLFETGYGSPKVFAHLYIDDKGQGNLTQAYEKIDMLLNELIYNREMGEEIYDD